MYIFGGQQQLCYMLWESTSFCWCISVTVNSGTNLNALFVPQVSLFYCLKFRHVKISLDCLAILFSFKWISESVCGILRAVKGTLLVLANIMKRIDSHTCNESQHYHTGREKVTDLCGTLMLNFFYLWVITRQFLWFFKEKKITLFLWR